MKAACLLFVVPCCVLCAAPEISIERGSVPLAAGGDVSLSPFLIGEVVPEEVTETAGGREVRFIGLPAAGFDLQSSPDEAVWAGVAGGSGLTPDASGTLLFTDSTPVPGATVFYRLLGKAEAEPFTIRNLGDTPLTGISVGFSGSPEIVVDTSATGTTIPAGGSAVFSIRLAGTGASGERSGTLSISSNDADENPFTLAVSGQGFHVDPSWFRIVSVGTADCVTSPALSVSTEAGGLLAVSPSHVFWSDAAPVARYSAADLGDATEGTGTPYRIVSNLRNGRIYALARGNPLVPIDMGFGFAGNVDGLVELDAASGVPVAPASSITFSGEQVQVDFSFDGSFGFWSGWDRLIVSSAFASRFLNVDLASGVVSEIANTSGSNWPFYPFADTKHGVVESSGGKTFLVGVKAGDFPTTGIVRYDVLTGALESVAEFTDLGDRATMGFSVLRNRLYFHNTGASQFSEDAVVGYCGSVWDRSDLPVDIEEIPMSIEPMADVVLDEDETRLVSIPLTMDPLAEITVRNHTSSNQSVITDAGADESSVNGVEGVRLTPVPGATGTTVITVRLENNKGQSAEQAFGVTVVAANDLPVVSSPPARSALPGQAVVYNLTVSDEESAAAELTLSAVSGDAAIVPQGNVIVGGSGGSRTVTVSSRQGNYGTVGIAVTVMDPDGGETVRNLSFTSLHPIQHERLNPSRVFFSRLEKGCDIVQSGTGLRASGNGTGTISVTGVGTVKHALLLWHGPDAPLAPVFAGTVISGRTVATDDPLCENDGLGISNVADVTALVTGDGDYALSGFGSDSMPGGFTNGASLIIIHDDDNPANNRDVIVYFGNDANVRFDPFVGGTVPDPWSALLAGVPWNGAAGVEMTFHVAEGQAGLGEPPVTLNGIPVLPADAFAGASVPGGGFWDVIWADVTGFMAPGRNQLLLRADGVDPGAGAADCIGLCAIVLSLPSGNLTSEPTPSLGVAVRLDSEKKPLAFWSALDPGGDFQISFDLSINGWISPVVLNGLGSFGTSPDGSEDTFSPAGNEPKLFFRRVRQ